MNILFVGIEANRTDLLRTIEPTTRLAQCVFLENFDAAEITNDFIYSLGSVVFWKNYADAFQLLRDVQPQRIVYVLLDNYYHFALLFAARSLKIPVSYLDHGIRFEHEMDIMADLEKRKMGWKDRLRKSSFAALAGFMKNTFYRNTLRQLPAPVRADAVKVYMKRSRLVYGDFMRECGALLVPDRIVAYAPETLNFYRRLFGLPASYAAYTFTGIPSLDDFSAYQVNTDKRGKGILFIDQPLHEQALLGWTRERKFAFWKAMTALAQKHGLHLYIKPHPWNEPAYADMDILGTGGVTIVNTIDQELIRDQVLFVGSFNSTLLLAFCAMKDLVTFCWDAHPQPSNPPFSTGITKYGTAEAVHSWEEMDRLLQDPQQGLHRKAAHIDHFIQNAVYAFDGNAKSRITKALMEE